MTEPPSDTANHQRLEEMLVHLTPLGAVIPYSVCLDANGDIWVAAKGGLFKLHGKKLETLLVRKNDFPKKMMPYCQVHAFQDKVIHIQAGEGDMSEFRVLDLEGNVQHEQLIDGKIQSFCVDRHGDMFMTKQPANADVFYIYKSSMDAPLGWEELCTAYDYCFQALALLDDGALVAATSTVPINMYSKQTIKIIDPKTGKFIKSFSQAGREQGHIYFPRCIRSIGNDLLVMDKTGRFQRFDREGRLLGLCVQVDAYLANGFAVVDEGRVLVACSGIVQAPDGETICDDWLEYVDLDGSRWTDKKK